MGAIVAVLFPLLMAFTAFFDMFTMRIPNWISAALIIVFALIAVLTAMPIQMIGMHLLVGVIVLAVGFILFALRIIGGGDAKAAAAIALWMGTQDIMPFLFYASLFGGGLTLLIIFFRRFVPETALPKWEWLFRLHDKKQGAPYGIALALGAMFVYAQSAIYSNMMLLN